MHDKPIGAGDERAPTTAEKDALDQGRVLEAVLFIYPESLTLAELTRELTVASPDFQERARRPRPDRGRSAPPRRRSRPADEGGRQLPFPGGGQMMDGRHVDREAAERIGRNVFMARRRAGFSQEALGALACLHRTEVAMVERGERLPRVDTLLKLGFSLAVPVGDLVAGVEWVVPASSRPGSFAVVGR
jgi:DNA-binding XRE family transcriptional regulator